jgi:hypothetical protein
MTASTLTTSPPDPLATTVHYKGTRPSGPNSGGRARPLGAHPRLLFGDRVSLEGEREVLGIWWQETEGAKFWLAVLNDLHHRGVEDILVCCVDGLAGFPEAIEAVFPQAWVQTCIVHQIRNSMRFVAYQDRKRRGCPGRRGTLVAASR